MVKSPKLVDPSSPVEAQAHLQGSPAQLPTPIKVGHLLYLLSGYTHSIVEFLIAGLTHGFHLHFEGFQVSSSAPNLLSALQNPELVDVKLNKELNLLPIGLPVLFPSSLF